MLEDNISKTKAHPEEKEPDFLISGIKKNVFVLGLVSLFTDIASEMIYPIIPLFLTLVLGVPMSVVGLIEGLAESAASILTVVSGWFSDKKGLRKLSWFWGTVFLPYQNLSWPWHTAGHWCL